MDPMQERMVDIWPVSIWRVLLFGCIFNQLNIPVASLTKEVNPRLVKRPFVFNGRLANRGLTSLVKEATNDKETKPTAPVAYL